MTQVIAIVGAISGLLGTFLASWARWEQIKEARQRRAAALPRVEADIGEGEGEWHRLVLTFRPREGERYKVESVKVEKGYRIAGTTYETRNVERSAPFNSSFWEERTRPEVTAISVPHPDPTTADETLTIAYEPAGKRPSYSLWISGPLMDGRTAIEPPIKLSCRWISRTRERFEIRVIASHAMAAD
ncbi:hypothetical protein J5J86_14075 [Aquabacter sp. L1I39]|uniref:hypothetical protein n=1 Tax=Aquabacter sp. L1I39 TaxID=2820278 RepID=UPI001ADC88EB|nr:hypothetical protein [Aquabacter sp. L1I39]QTL01933.1 hypothetical protein J5J86_14075 [Aquabacter sp. L1I39]